MCSVNKMLDKQILVNFLILSSLFFFPVVDGKVYGQAERRLIREGNRLYQKEQFDQSELSYRRALEKDDDSFQASFNLGNALYKQERYDESQRIFGELADEIHDPLNRSKVLHNLGNSLLSSGQVEHSIGAYMEALRNNPDDAETRYNLAFARHLLDEMENREKENGDDQEQKDDQQGDDDQDQGDDRDSNMAEDQDDDGRSPERDREPLQRPDQISREDALRMLEAAEREEQRVQGKLMEQQAAEQPQRSGRNW